MRFYKEVTMKNMLRVAAVTPKVHIGSVSGNVREIILGVIMSRTVPLP